MFIRDKKIYKLSRIAQSNKYLLWKTINAWILSFLNISLILDANIDKILCINKITHQT